LNFRVAIDVRANTHETSHLMLISGALVKMLFLRNANSPKTSPQKITIFFCLTLSQPFLDFQQL